ncbi:hypothetical protein D3C76_710350 [compost metagenome]
MLAVQAGQVEHFLHQLRAVARPHPEGVAGFVGQPGVAEFESEQAGFLGRAAFVQTQVGEQFRGIGVFLADRRGRFFLRCGHRRLEQRQQLAEPGVGAFLVVGVAFQSRQQGAGAQFGKAAVEVPAVLAELVVVGVAQGQHRIVQPFQIGLLLQRVPETLAVIRGIAVAEGAAEQEQLVGALQLRRGVLGHAAQLDGQTGFAQAGGEAFGESFGIAGLRGPEQGDRFRGGRCDGSVIGRSARFYPTEQPCKHAIQPQAGRGGQRRVGRQAGHAVGVVAQAVDEAGQPGAFAVAQHRWRAGVDTDLCGEGVDARHGGLLWKL